MNTLVAPVVFSGEKREGGREGGEGGREKREKRKRDSEEGVSR